MDEHNYTPERNGHDKDTEIVILKPSFDFSKINNSAQSNISRSDILAEQDKHLQNFAPVKHRELLSRMIEQINNINFREKAGFTDEKDTLRKKHFLVCSIEEVLDIAHQNNWGICKSHDFIYLYNGAYWSFLDRTELQVFLGEAAEKMGVDKFDARHYVFREQLEKQFLAVANL